MPSYLTADLARDHIQRRGIPIGRNGLKDHHYRGTGPQSAIINGRRVYTTEWLDSWLEAQAACAPAKRRRASAQTAAA